MPKTELTDPNLKKESSESEAVDSLKDAVADVKEELRALVRQTTDVAQELNHIDAAITELQEAVVVLTAALLSDPARSFSEKTANDRLYRLQQLFAE